MFQNFICYYFKMILLVLLLLGSQTVKSQINKGYLDSKLSFEERVKILVKQLTLDEKISQMQDISSGLPRFGIPAYNWWNEGLHGVAQADIATVFPQAIGLAATFNDKLLFDVATAISDEFRAKYNHYQKLKDYGRYKGLTVWSPNINIFRDPRWGRGQETYGEDPWLTGRMGISFIKGLQGNDPLYLKTVATPKHYIVHSGPESLRHVFDANVSDIDFFETYAPAFEACVKEAAPYSIMGAYNRFRGESCSASDTLLNYLLRKKWGFKGLVVSDCGAIADVYQTHKIVETPEEAAALGVKSGCDLECGSTYSTLKTAVEKGYITESQIDVSIERIFMARFKLGMFDDFDKVPYNQIPFSENDSEKHRELSIKVAQQSIVLLKNTKGLLPLRKNLKNIAVIGPNANNSNVMFGNYNGTPSKYTTILKGIENQVSNSTKVSYYQGCNHVDSNALISPVSGCFVDGLTGEYFNNENLSGKPVFTNKTDFIEYSWFSSPYQGINPEHYSVRWTGDFIAPETGDFQFIMAGDDGYSLFINDNKILSDWDNHGLTTTKGNISLTKGQKYKLRAEFFNGLYGAKVMLNWITPGNNSMQETIENVKDADVIVFVGGLSPSLEGEEMPVVAQGFFGGDRTTIDLPSVQTNLLKKLSQLNIPIVFVLLNGSALAVNWEAENIPAIVEAWYPGQEGGTAVADVLFGNVSPSGRLPVTFYKSVNQLPAFDNYDMKGRTYRYFTQQPLYPFGYGLSYTSFKYSKLHIPSTVVIGKDVSVSVKVKNTGKINSGEVVQLYVSSHDTSESKPIRQLKGFERVFLKAGEAKEIHFNLDAKQFSFINKLGQRVVSPGNFTISVGGSQPKVMGNKGVEKIISLTSKAMIID